MKDTKKKNMPDELPMIDGQISLDDIFGNYDDGTYGKPIDEYAVVDDE